MALCRCLKHGTTKKNKYTAYLKPIGYPNTSSICGRINCENPGVIWIEKSEATAYQNGQRIFSGQTNVVKMKADERGIIK